MSDDRKKDARERFQMVVPPEVLAEVRELAAEEDRSVSNMLVVLVREALKMRQEQLQAA